MPRWYVCLQLFGSLSITVDAETEEEARAKALDEAYVPSLCWHCAKHIDLHDEVGDILEITLEEE